MKPVAFRIGILAALLSNFHEGKFVGVMVTASHNPVEDNGVKLVDPQGEMIVGVWEDLATELANVNDCDLLALIERIKKDMKIYGNDRVKVAVARDTRPSGIELCEAIEFGVNFISSDPNFLNLQLQTTPQLHFSVFELNTDGTADGYIEKFSKPFEDLLNGKKLNGNLVIDAANGIGTKSTREFAKRLKDSTNFDPILINTGDLSEDILNHQCGADFVKIQMTEPKNVKNEWRNCEFRFVSLDGDADRLIYFYFDEMGKFKMLDGDRISVLFSFYLRKLLKDAGLLDKLKFGVVQTAYANGASTAFLKSQGISVSMACTGVKNLHHVAAVEYDVGVYFEANGHGTILFGPRANEIINKLSGPLKLVKELINQCVGDALSDILLVETILCHEEMTLATWDSFYDEFPSRQLKVKVTDRSIFKTTAADTKLIQPNNLQPEIDRLVAETLNGRAFVRPSGTEDVVRIYAEAETRELCDQLAHKISELLQSKINK